MQTTVKEAFFDRSHYLEIIDKRIKALKDGYRQNLAIIGHELVGKTALIFTFLQRFNDTLIIPVYVELRQESLASFGKRFIAVLLYNFLGNSGIPLKEDLNFLIHKSEVYIPRTIAKIKALLPEIERKKKESLFIELLSLCELIHQETGKFCVVIFDEFHLLEQFQLKKLYEEWAKVLLLQKHTLYIISSSLVYKARGILSKDLSLLFGNFEQVLVEPFDIKTSEHFLNHALKDKCAHEPFKNFIINFTGGYPFYLSLISEALRQPLEKSLTDILEEMLFAPSGILHQRFSAQLKHFRDSAKGSELILKCLYLIAEGRNKIKDMAHLLHKTKRELDAPITMLLELDTITRSGDFLQINDRVFAFWLTFVHQGKLKSLTFDAKNQKLIFRQKIEEMIREFIVTAKKPVTERVMELLKLFEDDSMQIEKKRVRLTHFREIKPVEFKNINLKDWLVCRSEDSLWLIAFTQEALTESDITEFTKECKRYRHKAQKKILVTFNDIDTNSRLRAMEEKIWMWDVNSVNQMLDLYSKPRIIA